MKKDEMMIRQIRELLDLIIAYEKSDLSPDERAARDLINQGVFEVCLRMVEKTVKQPSERQNIAKELFRIKTEAGSAIASRAITFPFIKEFQSP